jgi:phosphonoacetaldehyde hydrolase
MTTASEPSSFVPLRAVIFDWAGTVCDFGSLAPVLALQKLFATAKVPISIEQARGPMGRAKRDHIADVLALPEVSVRWQSVHGQLPGEADIDHLYAQFLPLQLAELRTRATLIPGVVPMTTALRQRGILIGSTTGYTRELMAELAPTAAQLGYCPDAIVTVSDVPAGRPAPWMALRCAEQLGAWPLSAVVKVGDTVADIQEGLNAGMWTVGFARCGNEVGLDEASLAALPSEQQQHLTDAARSRLRHAGAHFVVDGPAELLIALDTLELRRRRGDRP